MLKGKKILLGITGSIAAYKSVFLVRLLVREGAEVKVIMTPSAKDFVTSLTLSTLSKNPVLTELFDEQSWANHVMLGRWADAMLIAPQSCNTLAKMGVAIARELYNRGADVTLISGPVNVGSLNGMHVVTVNTAEEMYNACTKAFQVADIGVMAAAVADYTPAKKESEKIKKSERELLLELKPTQDILKSLGQQKREKQVLVGF